MPSIFSKAPAKIILFGEHAVVYGQPAIAFPLTTLFSKVSILGNPMGHPNEVRIIAPEIEVDEFICDLPKDNFFVAAVTLIKDYLEIEQYPACEVRITSTIPIASGLGSSASIAVSLLRALFAFVGKSPDNQIISNLALQLEKIHHGNPSGIDNSVIAFEKPIYFIREKPIKFIKVKNAMTLIIGNTGIRGMTKEAVSIVREKYRANPIKFNQLFEEIGSISKEVRNLLEAGKISAIGEKMNQNHHLLQDIGVSCPELDSLVSAAVHAGAMGAKLCGSGLGGNMIALADEDTIDHITNALRDAGALQTYSTIIKPQIGN